MDTLTLDTIRSAQSNDLGATTAVINATEGRIAKLAYNAAQRMARGGDRLDDYRDEFAQVARIAVWEALPRWKGDTTDQFFAFIYATVETTLRDAVRDARNGGAGADRDAVKTFAAMLAVTDGDVYAAEKLCQTVPPKGQRLSADRANAARLAWQGTDSIDTPMIGGEDGFGGDILVPLAEVLATSYGVPEDMITAEDINREARDTKRRVVRGILDTMGANQAHVLRASFGIDPVPLYGWDKNAHDDELARDMNVTTATVSDYRTKGMKSFERRYIKTMARNQAEADSLTAAAQTERDKRKGRAGR